MSHKLSIKENTATLTLTIPKEKVAEEMQKTAEDLAKNMEIKGFRKGKAPVEVVIKQVGEMQILDRAAEGLIRAAFVQAMLEEDLETVGQPHFDAEKLAPGNDIVMKVTIALQPKLKKLADLSKVSVKKKSTKATKEQKDRALKDLALMQTKEIRRKAGSKLKKGDKAVINLTMKDNGVVLEGGEGRDHGVYTGEGHYIEGMIDEIIGMKEGETKEFKLPFPKDHYQKHLAGKEVDFEVKMNEIFELEAPKIDDEFAAKVGLKTKKELEDKIAENIQSENEQEEARRLEKEMFDAVIKKCTFDDIPELLVNQELQKMVQELAQNVKDQGMELEMYLKQIGKSLDEIKLDFTTTAMERIKASMILKHIIDEQKIKVTEKELDTQLDEIAEHYKDNEEAQKNLFAPQYRDYLENQMKHQKALEWLRDQVIA